MMVSDFPNISISRFLDLIFIYYSKTVSALETKEETGSLLITFRLSRLTLQHPQGLYTQLYM